MPKLSFNTSNAVAVGSFNIYVLQPKNLVAMGLVEEKFPIPMRGDYTAPGITFDALNCKWLVRPERFAVETEMVEMDCGALLGKVMDKLRWTPVLAIGFNFGFACPLEESFKGELRLPCIDDALQCTSHIAVQKTGYIANIQLSRNDKCHELSLNAHIDMNEFRNSPLVLAEKIQEYCSRTSVIKGEMQDVANSIDRSLEFSND